MGLLRSRGQSHGISERQSSCSRGEKTTGATGQTQSSAHYKGQALGSYITSVWACLEAILSECLRPWSISLNNDFSDNWWKVFLCIEWKICMTPQPLCQSAMAQVTSYSQALLAGLVLWRTSYGDDRRQLHSKSETKTTLFIECSTVRLKQMTFYFYIQESWEHDHLFLTR